MITGIGYYEGILLIGQISREPQYQLSKCDLISEFLKGNDWDLTTLSEEADIDPRILYRYRKDEVQSPIKNKEVLKDICIALGLDLVNSFILISKTGLFLNPIENSDDKKFMEFVNNNHEIGFERKESYEECLKVSG